MKIVMRATIRPGCITIDLNGYFYRCYMGYTKREAIKLYRNTFNLRYKHIPIEYY